MAPFFRPRDTFLRWNLEQSTARIWRRMKFLREVLETLLLAAVIFAVAHAAIQSFSVSQVSMYPTCFRGEFDSPGKGLNAERGSWGSAACLSRLKGADGIRVVSLLREVKIHSGILATGRRM
jgi:hypothetical protein